MNKGIDVKKKNEVIVKEKDFMPINIHDKYKLAQVLVKSGLIPQGFNTPEKAMVALQMGHELGLKPMVALNNISVVNGRATLSADLIVAIIRQHSEYAGMEVDSKDDYCTIVIKRQKGNIIDTFSHTFTLEDAKRAGLLNKDNWRKYPKRMLKHRAISYCARDAFPDAIAGIYTPEEMEPSNQMSIVIDNTVKEAEVIPPKKEQMKGVLLISKNLIEKSQTIEELKEIHASLNEYSWTEEEIRELKSLIKIKCEQLRKSA